MSSLHHTIPPPTAQTAQLWGELGRWEEADSAISQTNELCPGIAATAVDPDAPGTIQERGAAVHWGCTLLRLQAALRLGQEVGHLLLHHMSCHLISSPLPFSRSTSITQLPAGALLSRLKTLVSHPALPRDQRTAFALDLLVQLSDEGSTLLEVRYQHTTFLYMNSISRSSLLPLKKAAVCDALIEFSSADWEASFGSSNAPSSPRLPCRPPGMCR